MRIADETEIDRPVSPIESTHEGSITAPSSVSLLKSSVAESTPEAPNHGSLHHEAAEGIGIYHHRDSLSKVMIVFTDVFAIALGLGHFVFVCLIASYHGRPIDFRYEQFQAILTTIAPIFPMVFAFIVGRLLYHTARLRLEMGSSLGTLEQLIGSQTLGGAAAIHLKLGALNPLCIFIIALWSLSPLGGQSLLRILHQETPSETTTFVYLDLQEAYPNEIVYGQMNASYVKTLTSNGNILAGPTDPWGNIKIPFLQPEALNLHNNQSWHDLSSKQRNTYSAFFGVPIAYLTPGNSMLSLETTYLDLECESIETDWNLSSERSLIEIVLNQTALDEIAYTKRYEFRNYTGVITNGSWYGYQHRLESSGGPRWNIALNRFIDNEWLAFKDPSFRAFSNESGIEAGETKLLFQFDYLRDKDHTDLMNPPKQRFMRSQCRVLQKYVESRLSCSSTPQKLRPDCSVVAQRLSLRQHPPENLSFLSDPQIFGAISRVVPYVAVDEMETLNYIFDTGSLRGIEDPISAANLSTRLSQAINTFYLLHQTSNFMNPLEIPSYKTGAPFLAPPWAVGKATTTDSYYLYSITWPWMIVCLASCLILTLASIVGVGLVHLGHGPEVLGYVSTAIRDSNLVGLPPRAAQMDGDALSKVMRKRRFRYGRKYDDNGRCTVGLGPEEDITFI